MNCNNKKIQKLKYNKAIKQKEQTRKEYFETLTEEEKRQFTKEENERRKRASQIFSNSLKLYAETVNIKY